MTQIQAKAQELAKLPHVTTVPDGQHGHKECALQQALEDIDFVRVNTNGVALGEQAEMFGIFACSSSLSELESNILFTVAWIQFTSCRDTIQNAARGIMRVGQGIR